MASRPFGSFVRPVFSARRRRPFEAGRITCSASSGGIPASRHACQRSAFDHAGSPRSEFWVVQRAPLLKRRDQHVLDEVVRLVGREGTASRNAMERAQAYGSASVLSHRVII